MFDRVDPFYQGRARFDGDRLLTDDRAGIEAFVHVDDGDPRLGVARGDGGLKRGRSAMSREE